MSSWSDSLQDWLDLYASLTSKVIAFVEFRRWSGIGMEVQALGDDGNGIEGVPLWTWDYPPESVATRELWDQTRKRAKETDFPALVAMLDAAGLTVDETPILKTRLGGLYSKP